MVNPMANSDETIMVYSLAGLAMLQVDASARNLKTDFPRESLFVRTARVL